MLCLEIFDFLPFIAHRHIHKDYEQRQGFVPILTFLECTTHLPLESNQFRIFLIYKFQKSKIYRISESRQLLEIEVATMSPPPDPSVQRVQNYRQRLLTHGQHNPTKTLIDWWPCIEIEAVWVRWV